MQEISSFSRDMSVPSNCEKCGGSMEFKGVGEYKCTECQHVMYDDYGKVRNYLETHAGATQSEVAEVTGVSINKIRQLLKEEKIEIAPNSNVFLHCELCGQPIRSGRFCAECERRAQQRADADKHTAKKDTHGFGIGKMETSGAKRFKRDI